MDIAAVLRLLLHIGSLEVKIFKFKAELVYSDDMLSRIVLKCAG